MGKGINNKPAGGAGFLLPNLIIVDGHCDALYRLSETGESLRQNAGHFDLERASTAGLGLQVMALFSKERDCDKAFFEVIRQVDLFYREMECEQNNWFLVLDRQDLMRIEGKKPAFLLHLEGGEALGSYLSRLHLLAKLGMRSLGLTWNYRNLLADGLWEQGEGLSRWGREVIREMEALGIAVDLAHLSPLSYQEALEWCTKPPWVSHANVCRVHDHPRNLTDEQMRMLAEAGGVMGISFVSMFVAEKDADMEKLLDHVCHAVEVMGIDHVGFGSDFDGAEALVINGVEEYHLLPLALARRGFNPQEIEKLMGKNILNWLQKVLK